MLVVAGVGLDPWNVLAQGIADKSGVGIGWVTNVVGAIVLVLWIPLRQRPGVGTVANVVIVGTALQLALPFVPAPSSYLWGVALFLAGTAVVGLASGLYISARLGPGPRDGLMTGLASRLGWRIWIARTAVEATVLGIGWALGGTVGLGTVLFAVLIGPACHVSLRLFGYSAPGTKTTIERTAIEADDLKPVT